MHRPETLLVMRNDVFSRQFDSQRLERLSRIASLSSLVHTSSLDTPEARARLAEVEVLVTGWGCPPLTAEVMALAPGLRAVFHAAGSVRAHITEACWDRGILITSAAEANAVPVAEYTLSAVILAGKRILQTASTFRDARGAHIPLELSGSNFHLTIGIVGFSRVGRRVIDLLSRHDYRLLVVDPYAHPGEVSRRGAELVELRLMLEQSDIVSLHAPLLPETTHLLNATTLGLLRDGATVINTSRGSLIDTESLEVECVGGRLAAILDVTDPEPLPKASPLWELPNVFLTPHIAGAKGTEVFRLSDSALDELELYRNDHPPRYPITRTDLDRIA